MRIVYPSGAALATKFAAMVPPAPSLFSTTIVWPSVLLIATPIVRATTSVGPPAAKGTINVTGLVGYPCDEAMLPSMAPAHASRLSKRFLRNVFIVAPPCLFVCSLLQHFRDLDEIQIGVAHVHRAQLRRRTGPLDRT